MNPFAKLKSDGLEESQDRLGGFQTYESGVYPAVIKMAYAGQSTGGAVCVNFEFDLGNGRSFRETIYVSNKKGENFFLNKDNPTKKVPLPGFTTVEDICLLTSGVVLADQNLEDKMVKVYDPEAKKELPKSVPVLVDLLGKSVTLGILQTQENKNEKDGNGNYVPTAEVRMVNSIDKVFDSETKMTVQEIKSEVANASFQDSWAAKNTNVTRDKRTIKDGVGGGGTAGRPGARPQGAPPQAGAPATGRKSLFAKG